jgi:hypothetical protein
VRAQAGGGGGVLEVVEQRGGVEEGDGGDAQGHRLILAGAFLWEC